MPSFVAHRWPTGLWAGTQSVTVAACATVAGLITAMALRLVPGPCVRGADGRDRDCSAALHIVSAFVAALVESKVNVGSSAAFIVWSAIWIFSLLNVERGIFAIWIRTHRAQGRYARPVVIIGTNDEGRELYRLLSTEPELGYQVVGVVGDPVEGAVGWPVPWLGDGPEAVDVVRRTKASPAA